LKLQLLSNTVRRSCRNRIFRRKDSR